MKLSTSSLFWTFLWCWFMGVTAISIGFGALFPSMNRVAKPLVCPTGDMDLDRQVYNPYPGRTITTITWYCVDGTSGVKRELGVFPMSLYAGTLYGVLLFAVVFIGMALAANRNQRPPQGDFTDASDSFLSSEDTLSRMKELKRLLAADLISETEYEQKRSEILKNL